MLGCAAEALFRAARPTDVSPALDSPALNATHDPALRSWVPSANREGSDFPVQNLPFAVFRRAGSQEAFRGGVAIGDEVLDLRALRDRALWKEPLAPLLSAAAEPTLNHFMSLGPAAASRLRAGLSGALAEGSAAAARLQADLIPQSAVEFDLPARIGDYTDFYASIHHATAVGRQLRPDSPLLPNYRWIPIAYHGRSSSIRVSEHAFHRPLGQRRAKAAATPEFGPTRRLDFELEIGIFVGRGNDQGVRIPIKSAESHIFGLCLLNDWSARDIQGWEYQPLGPFLGKNFATTISPWVVTLEALAPFRTPYSRPATDPKPLPYLDDPGVLSEGALDIELEVSLQTAAMQRRGDSPRRLAASNFRHAYWTMAQMITHHTSGGCNLRSGDLLGSGTLSGPHPSEAGSLLELSAGGTQPIDLGAAESRTFLDDGDRVVLRAWCEGRGRKRIGFGLAAGTVLPACPVAPTET
jgi:fumarylacetoacetase